MRTEGLGPQAPKPRRDFRPIARRHKVDEPGRLANITHSLTRLAKSVNLRRSDVYAGANGLLWSVVDMVVDVLRWEGSKMKKDYIRTKE